ncbi:MAG: hypothetical protein A2039_09395 [Candidatus Melainabacteria bacterium GWA2_34_9]|nr:MAG: hypothetical protein A2039_09395 [Candidatus Melainabacteria bacterium GWA2_34_9]
MQDNNFSEAYYNKGIIEYEEGQYDLSIENFKKAIEINDSNFDYYYNLGLAYIKTEEYDLAVENFNKAITINNRDFDVYQNLGLAFFNKSEFLKAAKAYKKAVMLNSNDPENFENAGAAYFSLKNYKEAIFYFKQAVKLEPKNSTYNYNLAYTYYENENYELAEDFLISTLNYNRQNEDAYLLLGKVYLKQNDSLLAKDNFEKVLKINPDNEEALTAIEEINSKKKAKPKAASIDEAEPIELKASKEDEIKAENHFNSATELFENKQYETALTEFRKTLTLIKDHYKAAEKINIISKLLNEVRELYNKGLSHFSKNEYTLSINCLEKAVSIYPHNNTIKELLNKAIDKNKEMGQAYLKSGQLDLAIESLKTTLAENPEDTETLFTLGNVYLEQEEYSLALDSLRDTLSLDPEHKEAQEAVWNVIQELNTHHYTIEDYFKLIKVYINRQEYPYALKSLKRVLELDPDNSEAKSLILKVKELINQSESSNSNK